MKIALVFTAMALAVICCTSAGIPRKMKEMHPLIEDILKNVPKDVIVAELRKMLDPYARSSMDEKLKEFLNSLKKQFPTGMPDLGIPPLDPFHADHIDFDIEMDQAKIAGFFDNASINNLSSYNITYTKLNVFGLSVAVNFTLPSISADGYYKIDGELIDLLPVYGNGLFKLGVEGFDASVFIQAGTKDGFVFVKELDLAFHVAKILTHFEGLLGGGDLGEEANQIISDIAPEILNAKSHDISVMVSDKIVEIANTALQNVTLSDLIGIITGG